MPLDPSIALQVKPPQIMGGGDLISLQNMAQQSQLGRLQQEDMMQARQEKDQLRSLFSGAGNIDPKTGTVSLGAVEKAFAINPTIGSQLGKDRRASLKEIAEMQKLDAETRLKNMEAGAKQAEIGKQVEEVASSVYDQARARNIPEEQALRLANEARIQKIDDLVASGLGAMAGLTPEVIMARKSEAPNPMEWKSRALNYNQFLTDFRAQQGIDIQKGNAVETQRHNKVTEGQAAATLAETKKQNAAAAGRAEDGRIPSGYRKTQDGNLEPIPGGPATKPGEGQVKQEIGVWNTKNAISRYREALKNWSATDIALPDSRARMGTVYNDMLLQAKEAYNLGVLNGPDYAILQEVITNPASLKGGVTSKKALDDQAKSLDDIMSRVASTVSNAKNKPNANADDKLTPQEQEELTRLRAKHKKNG